MTGLVVAVISIMLGAVIIGQLQNLATSFNLPDQSSNAISNLFTQVWSAYNLMVLVPLILIAAVIIGIMGGWGASRSKRE